MTEQQIKKIKRRDPQAVRDLVHRYQDYVFSIVTRVVKNPAQAEEVTQDVFLRVVRKIDLFSGRSKFSTWLFTIAYRTACNAGTQKQNMVALSEVNEIAYQDQENHQNERQRILWQGIDRLAPKQGVALSLFYLQGFSINEISGIMNLPVNTVKSLLHRGRAKLKSILQENFTMDELTGI